MFYWLVISSADQFIIFNSSSVFVLLECACIGPLILISNKKYIFGIIIIEQHISLIAEQNNDTLNH